MTHELKILPKYFAAVRDCVKNFEIRKNDRNFSINDTIILKEWIPQFKHFSGRTIERKIIYILNDPEYCKKDYVILGLNVPADNNEIFYKTVWREQYKHCKCKKFNF